ncbi:hypothetical protein M378DRAFT_88521, partial [Amanita muscaria Koide BX008]
RYRTTRVHLMSLANYLHKAGWDDTIRPLLDGDIRAPDEEDSPSEGRRTFTWIWKAGSVGRSDSIAQEVLRIEWCKARARAHRWQEECLLLNEEMRRVLQFFDSEVFRWKELASADGSQDYDTTDIQEGRKAYVHRQANIRVAMRDLCSQKWQGVSDKLILAGDFKDEETGLVEFSPI